ncbi:hypothetical protein AMATHDRAFT_52661 [Amanita thiersii Skay4041]|uniref:TM7S3/TM198-like domain-containing protein n=1 Tax=Amanita thiersii Skay4041 TaxID=703135 RepID=A0A2A9P0V0_9AGAR|nr:hypothetical protein AMATHDRAFT_52661 [Amanita thiersii Skay4041]
MRLPLLALLLLSTLPFVHAQSSSASNNATSSELSLTTTPTISLSLTTSSVTVTIATRSGNRPTQITTVMPVIVNVTRTISPSTSATSTIVSQTSSPSSTPTPEPITLDTRLDPAFGVLGAILILTGLPSAFWGHKNRWTSFFLIGFYSFSLACIVLILKFGVLPAVNPPSKTLRGMFVLASAVAGVAGGAISIFFWKAARYGIGGWGGFAVALWIQCFRDGGVITPIGFRWILYIGCAVVGFTLCTIPRIHYHVLLVSTAFVGSSAFILGIDCYTTAGLKEFYIWNLGFRTLFPKFTNNGIQFPVTQTMQIELGLIGAVALMGIAVQLRILTVLQKKLHEIAEEHKLRDAEAEVSAAERFAHLDKERSDWEKDHPSMLKLARQDSNTPNTPLMKDHDAAAPPIPAERRSSSYTLVDGRPRIHSGTSDLKSPPLGGEDGSKGGTVARSLQTLGALPTLDLGQGIEENVPDSFFAKDERIKKVGTPTELEELRRKEELMAEIQTLRRSIDALKSETPAPSSSSESRRPSLTSRRTLSVDATNALLPPAPTHLRPPRETDPRSRIHSMELSTLARTRSIGEAISRPTSVPLRDEDWDAYIQERKLLQPPTGITPPIATTRMNTATRITIPPAVQEALNERKRRESALGVGEVEPDATEGIPLAKLTHHKHASTGSHVPVTILPPKKTTGGIVAPTPQRPIGTRTRTFEELNERHREKMRDMQAPLTQAEKEHADIEAAKQRWEKANTVERQAVTRRQAERAAELEKKRRTGGDGDKKRSSLLAHEQRHSRHSRSLSTDRQVGSHSKRLSVMKVEDWQRYQQETEMGLRGEPGAGSSERRNTRGYNVPFPDVVKVSRG